MTNEIVPSEFRFDDKYPIRVVLDESGESWFVANDVCTALEIDNVSRAVGRLDEDEKHDLTLSDTVGRPNKFLVISEAGLYNLTLTSRKSGARAFKRWVTHEVLPALRKTGKYEIEPATLTPAQALHAITAFLVEQEKINSEHEQRLSDIEFRQTAIEQGSKYFTILAFSARHNLRIDNEAAKVFGQSAARYSRNNDYEIGKAPDTRYGWVNTYHENVLKAVFGIYTQPKLLE